MRTKLALALIAAASIAVAIETRAQDNKGCHVAKSGGGTVALPIDDPKKMAELQCLDGKTPAPKITLVFPAEDQAFDSGPLGVETRDKLVVKYRLENYDVGKDVDGAEQHVHVVLDDKDYRADYSKEGTTEFTQADLTPGTHVLTVFPARAFHLAIKAPGAVSQIRFHWGSKSGVVAAKDAPQIIYSRPKGDYKGDEAKNILCDFYLLNVKNEDLASGKMKIVANIDGPKGSGVDDQKTVLKEWKPFIILKDPKPGQYEVTLELQDDKGETVGGKWNKRFHRIKIVE